MFAHCHGQIPIKLLLIPTRKYRYFYEPLAGVNLVIIRNFSSFVKDHPLEMSQEMPLMPAFTAGFTVFALLTMFHYVTVAHISPTVTFGFAFRKAFKIFSRAKLLRSLVGLI